MFLDVRCPGCERSYFRLWAPVCPGCINEFATPVPLHIEGAQVAVAAALHEGAPQQIVLAGKSQGRTSVYRQLAGLMTSIEELRDWLTVCELVTWIPGAPSNVRQRGYDQGELIAKAVARGVGLPATSMFARRSGPAQTGLSRWERQVGPQLAVVRKPASRVLLLDDVVTTGVSMRVATSLLRSNGADVVVAASFTTRLGGDHRKI